MRNLVYTLLLLAAVAAAPSRAEMIGGNPGPQHNYVCPHADGQGALDCFFDAVEHLYTMCRNVKAIEILEFGYEKADEGVNGAKSQYCLDKQKQNIAKPYKAALKEASISKQAAEGVRNLHETWLNALTQLHWSAPESDDDYKKRVSRPYDDFHERIDGIRKIVEVVREHTKPAAKPIAAKANKR